MLSSREMQVAFAPQGHNSALDNVVGSLAYALNASVKD